jgi:hypothetical protein
MMVDGAEEGQLKGPIDVLAPYTSLEAIIARMRSAFGVSWSEAMAL